MLEIFWFYDILGTVIGLLCFTLKIISMKKFLLLLMVLLITSCNRIVMTNYELIDSGVIETVDYDALKVSIISDKDSVCRIWFPKRAYDGLSLRLLHYTDSLKVGDRCFVYDKEDEPLISKVSIQDAKVINEALSRHYWSELFVSVRLITLIVLAFVVMGFWLFSPNNGQCIFVGIMLFFITTAIAVVWMAPNRKLEKVGDGTLTEISGKRFVIDNKTVYYSYPKDVFKKEAIHVGEEVQVYRYGKYRSGVRENIFISKCAFNDATLEKSQIYPEILLKTWGLYWALLLVAGGVLAPFSISYRRRKKRQQQS